MCNDLGARAQPTTPPAAENPSPDDYAVSPRTLKNKESTMSPSKLYDYEREYLLEALRRDVRSENHKVYMDPEWSDVHAANARRSLHLLQTLNPKGPPRSSTIVMVNDPSSAASSESPFTVVHVPEAQNVA